MKSALDSQTIEIPCPNCGKKSRETLGRIKAVQKLTCRHCRQTFDLDKTQMTREIAKVDAALKKTLGAFGRLGK